MEKRKVSFLLGLGIGIFPGIFAWFTLRRGHSSAARLVAFSWLALTFLFVVGSGGKDRAELPVAQASSSTGVTPVQTSALPRKVPEQIVAKAAPLGLGDEFHLGDYRYTINSAKVLKKVGRGYGKKKASKGARFVVVEYTIENLGKKTATVLSDDLQLVDGQGREFRASSEVNTALIMSGGNKDMLLSELQPGLKRNMSTGFEVPEDAANGPLSLVVPEKGLFGSKKTIVRLRGE